MRTSFCTICLVLTLVAPVATEGGDRKENSGEWILSARILRNGQQSGSGTYLESGLVITAAHLTAIDAKMSVRMAGLAMPAKVLKQGSSQGVDLSLLSIDDEKLPANIKPPAMQLCEAPPWPGDPVIIVDAGRITHSRIVPPQVLPYPLRTKFSTLIGDVAGTGSGAARRS